MLDFDTSPLESCKNNSLLKNIKPGVMRNCLSIILEYYTYDIIGETIER